MKTTIHLSDIPLCPSLSLPLSLLGIADETSVQVFDPRTNTTTLSPSPLGEDLAAIVYNLFVCLTTANHPDIAMKLFHHHPWSFVFLMSFMIITNLILLNFLLAVVCNHYADFMERADAFNANLRHAMLNTAFAILALKDEETGLLYVAEENLLKILDKVDHTGTSHEMQASEITLRESDEAQQDSDWKLMMLR